jgi:hypothetical protein
MLNPRRRRRRRRHHARRRKNPLMLNPRRRRRRRSRRANPFHRRRRHHRRRRNPGLGGMFGNVMSTLKEFGIGTVGAVVVDPFIDKALAMLPMGDPRLATGLKALAYPLLAGLGNRFVPSRHWHALGVVGFAISAAQLVKSFLPASMGGTGYLTPYGMGYLSPIGRGDMGYLSPAGIGAMAPGFTVASASGGIRSGWDGIDVAETAA